jgi:hypothetical protein
MSDRSRASSTTSTSSTDTVLSSRSSKGYRGEPGLTGKAPGRDWSQLSEEERAANAKEVMRGRTETRRNLNLDVSERGGRKHRKGKKHTKRHAKKKVHHRRR